MSGMIINPYAFGAPPPPPAELSFIGFTENTANQTDYLFSAVNIGAAHPTRRVVVVIHFTNSAVTSVLANSVTIGGIAATIHVQADGTLSNVAIVSALVPTGATADIFLETVSNTQVDRASMGVYRAVNETVATPHATTLDTSIASGVMSTTINIPANGWVVSGTSFGNAAGPTADTWVGVTEQYGGAAGDAAGQFRTGGFASGLPLETGRTVSCTIAATTTPAGGRLAAMSWG
jgi:hypothetical protein